MQDKSVKFKNEYELDNYVNKLLLFMKIINKKADKDVRSVQTDDGALNASIQKMLQELKIDDIRVIMRELVKLSKYAQEDMLNNRRTTIYITECVETKLACQRLIDMCKTALIEGRNERSK